MFVTHTTVCRLYELATEAMTLLCSCCSSERERSVMALVTAGKLNKQIAGEMNLSEVTIKVHRHNLMRKLAVRTVPDLVRIAETFGIGRGPKSLA